VQFHRRYAGLQDAVNRDIGSVWKTRDDYSVAVIDGLSDERSCEEHECESECEFELHLFSPEI